MIADFMRAVRPLVGSSDQQVRVDQGLGGPTLLHAFWEEVLIGRLRANPLDRRGAGRAPIDSARGDSEIARVEPQQLLRRDCQ
jgi:hypothetical protein